MAQITTPRIHTKLDVEDTKVCGKLKREVEDPPGLGNPPTVCTHDKKLDTRREDARITIVKTIETPRGSPVPDPPGSENKDRGRKIEQSVEPSKV